MARPGILAALIAWLPALAHAQPTASFTESELVPATPTGGFGIALAASGDTVVVSAFASEQVARYLRRA